MKGFRLNYLILSTGQLCRKREFYQLKAFKKNKKYKGYFSKKEKKLRVVYNAWRDNLPQKPRSAD